MVGSELMNKDPSVVQTRNTLAEVKCCMYLF